MKTARVPRLIPALLALACLGLSACSSNKPKFSCPAMTTGYGCQSMLEVYEITSAPGVFDAKRQPESRSTGKADARRATRRPTSTPGQTLAAAPVENRHAIAVSGHALTLAAPVQSDAGAFVSPNSLSLDGAVAGSFVLPLPEPNAVARLPAQVMRIWFAPWTDERGDLHKPSHVYTEIAGRRWAVGGDVRAAHEAQASFDPNGAMYPKSDLEGNRYDY